MIEVITDGHYKTIESLFDNAKSRIRIISPFLTPRMADLWCDRAGGLDSAFITRFYMQDFLDGSNSIGALRKMVESGINVYALLKLHTKLYLFDDADAIVGSTNFTTGGLISNVEMSLRLQDEDVIFDLHDYFEELEGKILECEDGIVTLDMLDEAESRYLKLKDKVKTEGSSYNVYVKGAAIDKESQKLKGNPDAIKKELEDHSGERKTDIVYSSMGGNTHDVSYTVANNIILKFFGTSKNRNDGMQPMDLEYVEDEGKKIYLSNFAVARKRKAESVVDNDVMFVCVHSYNAEGKPSPMIVGKGHLRRFRPSNDARKKPWLSRFDWLKEWPYYCVVDEARIIDAPIRQGIPLRELTDAMGYKTYTHTKDNPEHYTAEKVAHSHLQSTMLFLTGTAEEYLDMRLNELGKEYGWISYKSDKE